MKILLFAGAGTSIELGVPGMIGLADDFIKHVKHWNVEPSVVDTLMGSDQDLEDFIDKVDRVCDSRHPFEVLDVDNSEAVNRVASIRREVEWFVQHTAEKIDPVEAHLMWSPILRCAESREIIFVTTNYDRAIELAANVEGMALDDGFSKTNEDTATWIGFGETDAQIPLVKLHGSTNWYRDQGTGRATRLRNPMPLFGDGTLLFRNRKLDSALVLPSREKILTMEPYPWLSHAFFDAVKTSQLALFIGSSMRDPHIRQAAETIAERRPVFVVNPTDAMEGMSNARIIRETSSEFLISTLPNALGTNDPVKVLKDRCDGETQGVELDNRMQSQGVLSVVRDALDAQMEPAERCSAIGRLVDVGVTLPPKWTLRLLREDDATLVRHALGLIVGSCEEGPLVEALQRSPHMEDRTFRDEYDMLRKLVGGSGSSSLATPPVSSARATKVTS